MDLNIPSGSSSMVKLALHILMAFVFMAPLVPFVAQSSTIIPQPQSVLRKGFTLKLESDWAVVADMEDKEYAFCASWLRRKLSESQSLGIAATSFDEMPPAKRILLGNPENNHHIKSIADKLGLLLPSSLGHQGYRLEVSRNPNQEILILANTPQGVFYGIQTLLRLMADKKVEGVSIIDYPDHQVRAVDMGKHGSTVISVRQTQLTDSQKQAIDRLASLKINMLVNESVTHFFGDKDAYMAAYRELADYCRERYIDFVPFIGSLRETYWVPFDLIEGWWIKDEPFTFNSEGFAVADLVPVNLLLGKDPAGVGEGGLRSAGWILSGQASIDMSAKYDGIKSLKLDSGNLYIRIPVLPNSHYHLTASVKGASPVLSLQAVDSGGKTLYSQSDSSPIERPGWTRAGVVLKTDHNTKALVVRFQGGNKTAWLNNVQLRRIDGSLKNVIRSVSTDFQVISSDKTKTFLLDRDYTVMNGETDKTYSDQLASFRIRRLNSGNIRSGEKVLISYNAVLYWARTAWYNQPPCVSDERLYTDYYYPAIDKVLTELRPKMIHLASDEVRGFNRDSRNKARGLTNAQLFADWLNKIYSYIKSKDPSVRVMIWDDMVSPYHNGGLQDYQLRYGGSPGSMTDIIERGLIPKDVILNVWWYSNQYESKMLSAVSLFEDKGYTYLGAPWKQLDNIQSWARLLANKRHSIGGFLTNWDRKDNPLIPEFANWFWNTNQPSSSESTVMPRRAE